jgi:hypothetical protein
MDDLKLRLLDALDHIDPPPVPLDGITRRARRIRRQRAGAAAIAVAGCVALVLTLLPHPHSATVTPATHPPVVTNTHPLGVDGVFANGAVNGQAWELAVANVADDGKTCLPAVVLNGQNADLLLPNPDMSLTPAGAPSVISGVSPAPGTAYAFIQVPASVRQLRITIGNHPLTLTPTPENACGQNFRLAGLGYPAAAPVKITAVTSSGAASLYVLPSTLSTGTAIFRNTSQVAGNWTNLDNSRGWGSWRPIARTTVAGSTWAVSVADGSFGECYSWRNGQLSNAIVCLPVVAPGGNQGMTSWTAPDGAPADSFAMSVNPNVARVAAKLANGRTLQATPVDVGGRLYVSYVATSPVASLIMYDAAGNVVETCTSIK